jgi:serine/threonine protein kinase
MSPEQADGAVKDIDHRSDVFALGTICFRALYGVFPFDAPTPSGIVYKICHKAPDPGDGAATTIPRPLRAVLQRALAKKKEERYSRVEDFVKDFGRALAGEEVEVPRPRSTKRTWGLVVLGTGALLVATSAAFLLRGDPQPKSPVAHRASPDASPVAVSDVAPEPKTSPTPEMVQITLDLSPSSARVLLDGHPRSDNPLVVEASDVEHRLKVIAKGYVPMERSLIAKRSQTIQLALSKRPKARRIRKTQLKADKPIPTEPPPKATKKRPRGWVFDPKID